MVELRFTILKKMNEFWLSCVQRLEQDLPPQLISAWIKPLEPIQFDEERSVLRMSAPNRFKLDWVRRNFSHRIQEIATEWFGCAVELELELAKSTATPQPIMTAQSLQQARVDASSTTDSAIPSVYVSAPVTPTSSVGGLSQPSRLNPDLVFENFVTGKANQLARAAALQVAENPGTSYNPLFLYGGVGLGKTHLIQAVGNALVAKGKGVKVRYVIAEQYVAEVVKAYQRKTFDELKNYYHSLDLLLIDDIQFFASKARTQEMFFYVFEAMVAQGKQIIITSDTYPKELSNIESRLISRFDSGLTVAVEPPELEMRVAILLRKAQNDGIVMSKEVAFFIAKYLRSNVRELEGALRTIAAYARFHESDVLTVEICKDALKDLLSASKGQVTVENIQKTVADFYKIKVADMYSKRRPANIAGPRQIAMYLVKELTQKSLPDIGEAFGGRDHTTVLHAVRKISEARRSDTELNHSLHVLEQTLKG